MMLKDKLGEKESRTLVETIDDVAGRIKEDAPAGSDITAIRTELSAIKTDIGALKYDVEKINDRITDVIKWVAAMLVAQAAVIAAIVKLLSH